jgi:hypothetical protein
LKTAFGVTSVQTLEFMAEAVREGTLVIPISLKLPLNEAVEAQGAEKGLPGRSCWWLELFADAQRLKEHSK